MVTENEDGKELESRSYFAIGAVLGLAASIGLALLVFVVINTASSVKDAVSPPSRVPVAEAVGDTTSETDTGTAADDTPTDDVATDAGDQDAASAVAIGADLAASNGCVACHSTNGSDGAGPTWSGLSGSPRILEDGSTVTADDAYLLKSIIDPGAEIVDGWTPIMPGNFGDSLSTEELDALVAYIKSV